MTACGDCRHNTLKENSIQCSECGKYIVNGEAYNLTSCEYNTYQGTEIPTYANPKIELKKGKNLLEIDLLADGENSWTFWEDSGFYVALYSTAEALTSGDTNYFVVVDKITAYDYKGNALQTEENTNVSHTNIWGTSETATYYNHNYYLLIEVSEDVIVYGYFGDC